MAQININRHGKYLVVAGKGNDLARHVVEGENLISFMAAKERVVYAGELECFECYIRNPNTGQSGWDIRYIEGVREVIQRHYPDFDCIITKSYSQSESVSVIEWHHSNAPHQAYPWASMISDED